MHGENIKIHYAQQANLHNIYKNTKIKLLRANSAIWYNKICRTRQIRPNYISFKSNGKTQQDKKTITNSIRYRINQEIQFLYKKKQQINKQLYHLHLECAQYYNGTWHLVQQNIDKQINKLMNNIYNRLYKKLGNPEYNTTNNDNKKIIDQRNKTQRITNLTNIQFSNSQTHTLMLGPNYAIESKPERYINELIIDTDYAIKQLDSKIQNTYRHLAMKQLKRIKTTTRPNIIHKKHQHNLREIKEILTNHNATVIKADKSKNIVIINKNILYKKLEIFNRANNIYELSKDPTEKFQKIIQKTIQKNHLIIEKQKSRHLINIKPAAPQLNIYIKTHKIDKPIRPVIDNTKAPSYRLAKHINKKLYNLLNLPNRYTLKNSYELAQDIQNLEINKNTKMLTLDIKDLYVNLPIKDTIKITKYWLDKNNNSKQESEQIIDIIQTILEQNYFHYQNKFYKPAYGIAMGSPISSTMAEIYLQYIEETHLKQWLDDKKVIYYRRYVDDILILFNDQKLDETNIITDFNKIDKNLQFKETKEDNNTINYLDLTLHRYNNKIEMEIYRKPTTSDITINYHSNHPQEHKLAAYRYHIQRMISLPITKKAKEKEWKIIINQATNNGFPTHLINKMKTKLLQRKSSNNLQQAENTEKYKHWVTFTYYSPAIRKITNLFKDTNLKIAFKATNTIQQQLSNKATNTTKPSGIYKLGCNTCNTVYVGQSGRSILTRYKEHIRYIRFNNPQSAYAVHILQNRHEYGQAEDTLQLLKACTKGSKMTSWENMYIQKYHDHGTLITEQKITEHNPLYDLIDNTRIILTEPEQEAQRNHSTGT